MLATLTRKTHWTEHYDYGVSDYVLRHGVQKDYEQHLNISTQKKMRSHLLLDAAVVRRRPKNAYSSSESKGMCFQLLAFLFL